MLTDMQVTISWRAVGVTLLLCSLTVGAWAQAAAPRAPNAIAKPAAARSDSVRVLVLPGGETTLASPVPGKIDALHTGLGLPFREGQVLISLDCREPRARLAMVKAELSAATDQYEAKLRMQGLEQASD